MTRHTLPLTPILSLLLVAALLAGLFPPLPVYAQGGETPDPRPTLPPTWTPTVTRAATNTPAAIPTRAPTATPTFTPSPTLPPTAIPLPPSAQLEGMTLVWQTYNGCAVAALTMLLLYHGWDGNRDLCNRGLRPNTNDASVRSIEMVAFVEEQGLRGVVRTGGSLALLRAFIAAGFPVLVENVYQPSPNEWLGHNRIIVGYDDEAGELHAFDSVLGYGPNRTGVTFDYDRFDGYWQPFNRTFLVVYPPEQEATVQAILGEQWNATRNAEWTLELAEQEITLDTENQFAYFNYGEALLTLGHPTDAIIAFERALEIGLPWRYMWYRFGLFEAYLQVGRHSDVIALGEDVLNTTRNVEEIHYFMGLAYAGLLDFVQARRSFTLALDGNPGYVEAQLALDRLPAAAAGAVGAQ